MRSTQLIPSLLIAIACACERAPAPPAGRPAGPAPVAIGPAAPQDDAPPAPAVEESAAATDAGAVAPASDEGEIELPPAGDLEVTELRSGAGALAEDGAEVVVGIRARLLDGSPAFETAEGSPRRFRLSDETVIAGLAQGIRGMRAGGARRLTIPARLAYGQRGVQDRASREYRIPPGATIVAEVELLEVAP